jgi:hypothetical protein
VYSRRALRHSRRRPASRYLIRRLGLIAAAISIPVLLAAYAVMAAHGERAVNTASVSASGAKAEAGGWGRGGYEMMPGPAGLSAQRAVANAPAATSENWAGYVSDGGTPSYQGWFEMFPNAPCSSTTPSSPGMR